MIDKGAETEEHRRDCLARWICNLPTYQERRDFLQRLTRRHGQQFGDDIRERVRQQWEKRNGNRITIPTNR